MSSGKTHTVRFFFLIFGVTSFCFANSSDQDQARLLNLVPVEIEALAHSSPNCQPPGVRFTRADFDGDHSFNYLIASYYAVCGSHITSAVRVLKETQGNLLLYQIPSGLEFRPGEMVSPDVIDLENNGVLEVMLRVWQGVDIGRQNSLLLLRWDHGTLQPVSTANIDTRDAIFRDLDADGRLELMTRPSCRPSRNQKSKKDHVATSNQQRPSSRSKDCADSRTYVYRSGEFAEITVRRTEVPIASLEASDKEFSISETTRPPNDPQLQKEFVLRLEWSNNSTKTGSVSELQPQTLLLGRTLRPLAVASKLEKESNECKDHGSQPVHCFQAEALEARFTRESVARLLPRLQLTKKLEPGDRVSVPFTALMENGDYVSAHFTVSVSK